MNLTQCEQALQTQYDSNPNQLDNISQLTNIARSKDKISCMIQMGSIAHVKEFLTDKPAYIKYQQSKPVEVTTTTQTTAVVGSGRLGTTRNTIQGQNNYLFRAVGGVIGAIVIYKLIKKGLQFFYDVLNAHRIVYLKITLPRNDSRQDREQEKEIAKDMKEMI